MSRLPTEASFLKDVSKHEMEVKRDDGLYRHLRFSQPKTWNMGFDVTTWPGMLCFSGDMGCYVFSRIPDMMEFFRSERKGSSRGLEINPDYWGQKVEAVDRNIPLEEFSPDLFRAAVKRHMKQYGASKLVREAVTQDVLSRAEEGENEAVRAVMEFSLNGYQFEDFWECRLKEITYRFLWCCYALAWAVRKYDESKAPATEGVPV